MTEAAEKHGAAVDRGYLPGAAVPWLALAIGLLLVSNGRWIVPLATWLAPAALLVFLDRSRGLPALAIALVAYVLVQFVIWWGLIPAPGLLYFLIAGTYGVVYFLPFVAHRALAARLDGLGATLVFPFAWVATEFVFHTWVTPYGTWFSLAYTQTGTLTLLQLVSITGTAGVSFLITWFAALAAWTLRVRISDPTDWSAIKRLSVMYAAVMLLVLGYGSLRLSVEQPETAPIRVAGLVPNTELMRDHERSLMPARSGERLTDSDMAAIVGVTERLNDDLFRRTRREAAAGARLVTWSETAGRVLAENEAAFLARAGALAAEHAVHLMLGYGVWDPDAPKPFDNKVAAIDTNGSVHWETLKAYPIVGAESFFTTQGDGVIRSVEIGDATVAAVICHDLDFPRLFRQAADSGVGLMVGPSADWPEITPLHADMAIPRAIENGFSLFRPTSGGRSIAVDTRGRSIATADYAEDAFVAYLPTRSSPTIYGRIGDLFSWICLVGFVALGMIGARDRGKQR